MQRSAERFRLAIESGKIGTWDWNLVRDEIEWNERNYEIFGLPAFVPINTALFVSLIHADDRDRVQGVIAAARASSADFSAEFRLSQPERPFQSQRRADLLEFVEEFDSFRITHKCFSSLSLFEEVSPPRNHED